MSINPFLSNDKNFTNKPSQLNPSLDNKSQTNAQINGSNNQSQNNSNFFIFPQKNDLNIFNRKIEPNSNNENNKNFKNSFMILNTQPNNEIKSTNIINFGQNNKNNNLSNINSNNNNNNLNQSNTNIFSNFKGTNNPLNISSMNNNSKPTNNNNNISAINVNQTKKEEKKEETNIFLSQSNNKLINSNNQSQNNNNNKNEPKNYIISKIPNPDVKNPNIPEKKENQKVNDFINNLFTEDKIMFSEEERKKFEKRQLSHKSNEEIIDEFKNMLLNQKEKFHKLTNNSRIFHDKFINLINNIKNNSYETLNNEFRYEKLLEQIKLTEEKFIKLKKNMTNKDKTITGGLDYIKKNLNNNFNNLYFIKNPDFEKNYTFYKDLSETSDKTRKIDININIFWNSMNRNEKNKSDINSIYYYKEKENNFNKINNNMEGIFIERNNKGNNNNVNNNVNNNKIYVQQNDVDDILTECYDGLYSLKCAQEEFDNKYKLLKNNLIDKIKESNNHIGKRDIQQEDINL